MPELQEEEEDPADIRYGRDDEVFAFAPRKSEPGAPVAIAIANCTYFVSL